MLAQAEQQAVVAEQHAALAEKTEEEVLTELDLPNPDEMQTGDDFSVFMKSAVPAALRNRALRRLWTSSPVLANVDMLVDYGEDFTGKNDPVRLIKTIYRVGKGMLPDEEEPPALSEEVIEALAPSEQQPEPEDNKALATDTPENAVPISTAVDAPQAFAPRARMKFVFAEGDLPDTTETELS